MKPIKHWEDWREEHPSKWSPAQVIEWSQLGIKVTPLAADASFESIAHVRGKAIGVYLRGKITGSRGAAAQKTKLCKEAWEQGVPVKQICIKHKVKAGELLNMAEKGKWHDPPTDLAVDVRPLEGGPLISQQTESGLSLAVHEMQEQQDAMNLRGTQWEKVPFKKHGQALRMRMTRIVRRAVEAMERMDDDELVAEVKTLKSLAELLEKVAPPPVEESKRPNTLVHAMIFSDDGLPKKAANVIEIAGAA